MVNYYLKYTELFDFGDRVKSQFLKLNPKNFYRISRYEYSNGDIKSMPGRDSSLIFVIGVFDDIVNCLKLNEVRPEIFLQFVSKILKSGIKSEMIDNMNQFSDIVIPGDKSGKLLFESKIKTNKIYNLKPTPYRTYNLGGIKYIQKIELKGDIIKGLI
jgi:hypothetical protein